MRFAIASVVLLACATRHRLPVEDRGTLDEFRATDRASVEAIAKTVDQYDHHLTDFWDAARRISRTAKTWREMRARVDGVTFKDRELEELVHRYLEERAQGWSALERSFAFAEVDEATLRAKYSEHDADARRTSNEIDAMLAKLEVPVPAAIAPDAGVVLQPPPPAPPNVAYFFVGDQAVVLDDTGFHVVATEIGQMHVAENGVMWACASWRAVKWDGKRTTVIKPKVYNQECGIGPDGTLWVANAVGDDKDKLASFDGEQWKVISAPIGADWRGAEQIVVTRDGTVYAHAERRLLRLDNGKWHEVRRDEHAPSHSIEHIFIGGDGNAWIIHQTTTSEHDNPDALSPITRDGVGKPVFVDDHFQTSRLFANVDANGVATIYDARRNVIVQGKQELRLPVPNTHHNWYARPGGFAYDASGRLWVDLVDGLNVIDPDGTRHVFPVGSIDAIRRPISTLFVLGGGPRLPTAGVAGTRTMSGTIKGAANADVIACVSAEGDPPCGKGVQTWTARTDSEGTFTLEGVPRYRLELQVQTGPRGKKRWRYLTGDCCDGEMTHVDFGIQPDPQY